MNGVVSGVTSLTSAARPAPAAEEPGRVETGLAAATHPPGGGFAEVLAGRLLSAAGPPAAWQPVTLGEMLSAAAGHLPSTGVGPAVPAGPPPATAGLMSATGAGPGGEAVVAAALRYLGVPYLWGGDDPATGLDCSGLVQRAFADLGVRLPRVSADQARAGVAVPSLDEARPGDLVFWRGRGGRPNHIGVYLGDGRMVHAPRRGEVVRVDSVRAAPPDAIRRVA